MLQTISAVFFAMLTLVFSASAIAELKHIRLLTRDGMTEGVYDVREAPPFSAVKKKTRKNHEDVQCVTWFDTVLTSLHEGALYEVTSCTSGVEWRFKWPHNSGEIVWEIMDFDIQIRDTAGDYVGSCLLGKAYWFDQRALPGGAAVIPIGITRPIQCNTKG